MAEARWTVAATEDLEEIERFIARDSLPHAHDFTERLLIATHRLAVAPRSGRILPEYQREDLREVLFRGYRIVYGIRGDVVGIFRVLHGSRDLLALLGPQPWMVE